MCKLLRRPKIYFPFPNHEIIFLDWHIYALNNVYMLHLGKSWQQLQVDFTKKKKRKIFTIRGEKKVKKMQKLHKTKYKVKYTLCLLDIMKNNL